MSTGSKYLLIIILMLTIHILYILSHAIGLSPGEHTSAFPWGAGSASLLASHAKTEMLLALVLSGLLAVLLFRSEER